MSARTIGLIGIGVLALLLYLGFSKRIPFVEGYRVDAIFQSANQLRTGSPVRIAGVDVGKVRRIDNGPGSTTRVVLELRDEGRPIHRDATMRIRPRLFLEGGFYIELQPGSPSAPELEDGGTIPMGQTKVPVQFHQVLTALDRPTRDSLRVLLDELSTALDKGGARAIGDASAAFTPTLRDVAIVTEAAQGTEPHDVSRLVSGLSRVTGALADNDRELETLLTGLRQTAGALAGEDRSLRATMRGVADVLEESPPALEALDRAVPPTRRLARALRPGLRVAPKALTSIAATLEQLRAAAAPDELPRLLSNLRPALRDLPELSRRLRVLFGLVTPVGDCLRERVIPLLNEKVPDGQHSTNRPLWQDLAHAVVGLSSASQSFDGNGPWIRYIAGAGENMVSTGHVPGVGSLVGLSSLPVLGARPLWLGPGVKPPFRPDARCVDQAPPDLKARDGSGMTMKNRRISLPRKKVTLTQLERLVRITARDLARAARRRNG
jgi:virulence factor Mce-like protein